MMYKWVINILPYAYFSTRLWSLFPIGSWNVWYWGSFSVFIHHLGIQICIERWPLKLLHNLWGTMKRQVMRVIAIRQQVGRNVRTLSFWDTCLTMMQWVWLLMCLCGSELSGMTHSSSANSLVLQNGMWRTFQLADDDCQADWKKYMQYLCHIVSKIVK